MKKRMMVLMLSGLVAVGMLAGCGGGGTTETKDTAEVTESTESEEETEESEEEAEPETEEGEEASETEEGEEAEEGAEAEETDAEAEEGEEDLAFEEVVAPEEYADYVYGTAPLTSVYVLYGYTAQMAGTSIEELGYDGLSADDFALALDESWGITGADEDLRKEKIDEMLSDDMLLCDSDEHREQFYTGEWVPDGSICIEIEDAADGDLPAGYTGEGYEETTWMAQ